MEPSSSSRLARLISEVRFAATQAASRPYTADVRGLRLNLDFLRTAGASDAFLRVWEVGVDLRATPATPRTHRNHPSLGQHSVWAERVWNRLEKLGKVEFFPDETCPPRLNVNPCGLILKERPGVDADLEKWERFKARLIVDLRRGRVNERLPAVGVAYGSVELAVATLHQGDYMFVLDLADCFFNWRVADDSAWELGFFSPVRRKFGRYLFLPFGLGPAPGLNDASVKELLRLVAAHTGVSLVDFVDDFFGRSESEESGWAALEAVIRFFIAAGVPVSDKPTGILAPSQRQVWTGWVFDTVACLVSVTVEKCDKLRRIISEVLDADDRRVLRAHALASVAGLASHVAEVSPPARRRLHPVWADLHAAGVYQLWSRTPSADPPVKLSALSRKHLSWWSRFVVEPPARVLHAASGSLSAWGHKSPEFERWPSLALEGSILVIETDACRFIGWSYHICSSGRVVSGTWPADWSDDERADNADHNNYKELWVVVECVRRESEALRGWRVLFRVDNAAAEHYVNVRYGDVPSLETLAERLEEWEKKARCGCLARHLRGKYNAIADMGSRDPEFERRWRTDVYREAMPRPALLGQVAAGLRCSFSIDVFCDRRGWTALTPRWRCPEVTGFECSLAGECAWVHPPREILPQVLAWLCQNLRENPALQVAIFVPEDTGAPWFRQHYLRHFHRSQRWPAGSDLFRWAEEDPRNPRHPRLRNGLCSDLPYVVFASWKRRP